VLNKFPIIANHFILATKLFKEQSHELEADDLAATLACLKEWEKPSADGTTGRLFAFFNSGSNSGASQAHRHVQFLPIDDMREGDTNQEWEPLIDLLAQDPGTRDNLKH
jgi:ATP adenylyltransferase